MQSGFTGPTTTHPGWNDALKLLKFRSCLFIANILSIILSAFVNDLFLSFEFQKYANFESISSFVLEDKFIILDISVTRYLYRYLSL